jgi:hypothetical protein
VATVALVWLRLALLPGCMITASLPRPFAARPAPHRPARVLRRAPLEPHRLRHGVPLPILAVTLLTSLDPSRWLHETITE